MINDPIQEAVASGSGTAVSVTIVAPAQGNTLILCVATERSPAADKFVSGGGVSWILAGQKESNGDEVSQIWYGHNSDGTGTAITFHRSVSGLIRLNVTEWQGLYYAEPSTASVKSGDEMVSNVANAPSITARSPGYSLMIAALSLPANYYLAGPFDQFVRRMNSGSGALWLEAASLVANDLVEHSPGWTLTISADWALLLAVFSAPYISLEIDWNNDGDYFDTGENVTPDLLPGTIAQRGKDQIRAISPPMAGQFNGLLNNTDRNYSVENESSPLYGLLEPGKSMRLRAGAYDVWTGILDDLLQHPDIGDTNVGIPGLGTLSRLREKTISTALYQNINTGIAIQRILDVIGGWPIGENICSSGTASASSTFSGFPASIVNNGDRRFSWWNDNTNNAYPDWVQVAFAQETTINEVNVFTVSDDVGAAAPPTLEDKFSLYGIVDFEVQAEVDGDWVTVRSVVGNNKVWTQFLFPSVKATAIRVYITNALDQFSRVVEIEAYNNPIHAGDVTLDFWWVDNQDAFTAIVEILNTEGAGASIYEDALGRLVFENRNYRNTETRSTESQHTFIAGQELLPPFEYAPDYKDVFNICEIPVDTRAIQARQVIWELGSQLVLESLETADFIIHTSDPIIDAMLPSAVPSDTVQALTPDVVLTSGSFKLRFRSEITSVLNWNDTASTIQAALEGLSTVGSGNILCNGGPINILPIDCSFVGVFAGQAIVDLIDVVESVLNPVSAPATIEVTEEQQGNGIQSEVQALRPSAPLSGGGPFTVSVDLTPAGGGTGATGNIAYNATAATVQTKLRLISGMGSCLASGGPLSSGVPILVNLIYSNNLDLMVIGGLPLTANVGTATIRVSISTQGGEPDYIVLSGSAGFTLDRTSGASVKLSVKAGAAGVTLSVLRLSARPVTIIRSELVKNNNDTSASQSKYGKKSFSPSIRREIDRATAQTLANGFASYYQRPRPNVVVKLSNALSGESQMFGRQISDRITVVEPQTGVNNEYWIEQVAHAFITADIIETEFGCEAAHSDAHSDTSHADSAHTDSHTDAHTDTSHVDSHSDSAHGDGGHTDSHADAAHVDSHSDVAHSDVVHTDTHSDGHADSHTDSHSDDVHTDTHGDASHSDGHSDTAHSDTAHSDSHADIAEFDNHGDSHADNSHSDGFSDGLEPVHIDSHTDSFGDEAHSDFHSDVAHVDAAHTDTHADSAHADAHTDAAFADSHTDAHTDTAHGDAHSDTAHSDSHTDSHTDTAHTDTHSDASHTDSAHSDSHTDSAHSDVGHADTHTDTAHSDSAHSDSHTDSP